MLFPLGWFPRIFLYCWPFAFLYWAHLGWAVLAEVGWLVLLYALAEVNRNWGRRSRRRSMERHRSV